MQVITNDIVNLLVIRLPEDALELLATTMVGLYPDPNWNFVFGQASPEDRVGVYSFARYDPRFHGEPPTPDSRKLILRRSCKVLAQEAAHMIGIGHFVWYRCLMNGSYHLTEADARPLHLCAVDLCKLQGSIRFDVLERYSRLRPFQQQVGFEDEAHWLDKRIRLIALYDRNRDTR